MDFTRQKNGEIKQQSIELGVFTFDRVDIAEPTPNFFNSHNKWNKFKVSVMDTKNIQFQSKVLKENILNKEENTKINRKDQKINHQFLSEKEENQKENQSVFVADDLSQSGQDVEQNQTDEDYQDQEYQEDEQQQQEKLDYIQKVNDTILQNEYVLNQNMLSVPTSLGQSCLTDMPLARQKLKKKMKSSVAGLLHSPNSNAAILNKQALLSTQIPQGIKLKCKLKRRNNIMSYIHPEFDFYLQNGYKHMLSAKKHIFSQNRVFSLSTALGQYKKSQIIATLISNALHNKYFIAKQIQKQYHEVLGQIKYGKLNKIKQLRDMHVAIAYKSSIMLRSELIAQLSFDQIIKGCKLQLFSKKVLLKEDHLIDSDKNFQLIDSQDDFCFLKLKKQSNNIFSIEIQHPLSPLQAFAIILTRFDAQLK